MAKFYPSTETSTRLFCELKHPLGHWLRLHCSAGAEKVDALTMPESIPYSEFGFSTKGQERRIIKQTTTIAEEEV